MEKVGQGPSPDDPEPEEKTMKEIRERLSHHLSMKDQNRKKGKGLASVSDGNSSAGGGGGSSSNVAKVRDTVKENL